MAKARMLHKKISISTEVNKLSLPARLLFTWIISHADDEGRLKGEPEYIKAMVIPMTKWSFKKIKGYLEEMKTQRLIYYWEQNNEWFIEFPKWKEHQSIKGDRFKESSLPPFHSKNGNNLAPDENQSKSNIETQSNIIKSNLNQDNKSEENKTIADKNSFKGIGELINPKDFIPETKGESAALDTWNKLEPYNPLAFKTTYLKAYRDGLPADKFYEFSSEIKQDSNVKKPGAVFNKKVDDYLNQVRK